MKTNCACGKHHISWWTRTWPKIPFIGKPLAIWITNRRIKKFEQEMVDAMVKKILTEIDDQIIKMIAQGTAPSDNIFHGLDAEKEFVKAFSKDAEREVQELLSKELKPLFKVEFKQDE